MAHSKTPWRVRELGDTCFVEADKNKPNDPYNIEVLGDDTNEKLYPESQKREDAELIVKAVNAYCDPLAKRSEKITLLERYSEWLQDQGYLDTDWQAEPPYAIDEFLKAEGMEPRMFTVRLPKPTKADVEAFGRAFREMLERGETPPITVAFNEAMSIEIQRLKAEDENVRKSLEGSEPWPTFPPSKPNHIQ